MGEAAQEIVRFISNTSVEYAVASPDLWNRRQDSGKSGVEIMQSVYGMPQMVAADDRRIPGWRALKEYLSQREDKVPVDRSDDWIHWMTMGISESVLHAA